MASRGWCWCGLTSSSVYLSVLYLLAPMTFLVLGSRLGVHVLCHVRESVEYWSKTLRTIQTDLRDLKHLLAPVSRRLRGG